MNKIHLLTIAIGTSLVLGCTADVGTFESGNEDAEAQGDGDDGVGRTEQALVPELGRIPLVTFYSAARGDYFTTTQPAWVCRLYGTCAADPGYRAIGLQGYVYSPDRPRPAGTVPLYHWYSPSREDNFLTTNPVWAGAVGDIRLDSDGYYLFRIEGYIRTTAVGGETVPLESFWNPAVRDNAAVSPRVPMPAGWGRYRTEGFLVRPNANGAQRCVARAAARYVDSPPWIALGNSVNTWISPKGFQDGDSLQISANGDTRIDFWGTHKNVAGEGVASPDFPCPGEPMWSLIGRVTTGRMWVPGKGSYPAGVWFPVGAGTGCMEYDTQGASWGDLELMINDTNIGDNAGGPNVVVSQHY